MKTPEQIICSLKREIEKEFGDKVTLAFHTCRSLQFTVLEGKRITYPQLDDFIRKTVRCERIEEKVSANELQEPIITLLYVEMNTRPMIVIICDLIAN